MRIMITPRTTSTDSMRGRCKLGPCNRDPHVERPLSLRVALGESMVPVVHAGILADDKANGPQVGGHLIGCPGADLRLAYQSEHQPHQKPAMNGVVVHDQRRSRCAP